MFLANARCCGTPAAASIQNGPLVLSLQLKEISPGRIMPLESFSCLEKLLLVCAEGLLTQALLPLQKAFTVGGLTAPTLIRRMGVVSKSNTRVWVCY